MRPTIKLKLVASFSPTVVMLLIGSMIGVAASQTNANLTVNDGTEFGRAA